MIVAQWNQNLRQMALPVIIGALLPAAAAWAGGLSLPAAAGVGGLGLCSALIFCRLWRRDRRIFQADSEMLEMVSAIFPGIWYECRIYPDGSRVFLRVSQNISDLLGIDPERLKRAPLQLVDWLHPEDRERILNGIVEHSRTLEPWRQEYRLVRPDGKTLWVKSRAQISREADGSALWRGVIFDRTAHREAAEAIRKSEERLAMATRAGKVAIWDYDLTTQHISWNDVAYELHGVDPLTYQPTPANNAQFVHPDERDWVYRKFERSLADGSRDYEAECRIVRPDGEVRHTRSAAVILRDGNGKPYRVIGTEIDVTEPKRLEADLIRARDQAEAATRTKNEFLAMMSHEIRTPLNGVLGFAGLLRDSPLTEQQSDYVSTIESSAESLLLLVGDILDLSRIEANQLKIAPAFFELRPCLQEVAALLHPRAEQKGLAWEMEVPPEAPRFIMLDRLRFVQILTNLIGNAIKFTESGSIRLRVEATPEPAGASQWKWRFAVQDTGRGLSPEVQQSLFTPDFRAIPPEHRSPGGTGLGLAICRRPPFPLRFRANGFSSWRIIPSISAFAKSISGGWGAGARRRSRARRRWRAGEAGGSTPF